MMSRCENFYATLENREPEKLILDLAGCPLSGIDNALLDKISDLLGFNGGKEKDELFGDINGQIIDERILKYLDIDTRPVGSILSPKKSLAKRISNSEYIDEWGMRYKYTGLYWEHVGFPLRGARVDDLDSYPWPEPESIDYKEIEAIRDRAKYLYENTDYVICASHPVYGIFELGCWMCGFDDFLIKMALDTDFIKKFFNIILAYQEKVIDIYYSEIGEYIHYTSSGDDFAIQENSFVSPETFDALIKPYFEERIRYTRKYTKAAYLHHSCGNVHSLIPSLIEAGVQILNPIQPVNELMSAGSLKKSYSKQICFHGGIDTQKILPFGTEEDVKKEVKGVIDIISKDGGYIFAAAHNLQKDVPPENVIAMFKAARECYAPGSKKKTGPGND